MLGSDVLGSKALGSALTYGNIIYPIGIQSSQAFGTAKLNLNVLASGIASAQAFGNATVNFDINVYPIGIQSSEAFGNAKLNLNVLASGIASSEAFGTAKLNLNVLVSGIASAEAFGGVIIFVKPQADLGDGIYGNYLYGNAAIQELISSALYILASGISSVEAFGNAKLNLNVLLSGIGSVEAFGTATVNTYGVQYVTNAGNISSLEAFGNPYVTIPEKINYDWIPYIIVRLHTEDSLMCQIGGIKGNA